MFPVDLPALQLLSASDLHLSAQKAMSQLRDWLQSSHSSHEPVRTQDVGQLRIFEDDQLPYAVLALHPPNDQTRVLALHLHDCWWSLDDVLRTACTSRSGLVPVKSTVERVIVFLLSRVVDRPLPGEVLFVLHPRTESCKVLWSDGAAVGFYTVKLKGNLCDGCGGSCYLLPVLDTLQVRRSCRRRGFGLRILEDFCLWFQSETFLGVSTPLSASMAAVCRKFLQRHEEDRERLYEVEAPGDWTQRRNIWLSIQLGRYPSSTGDEKSGENSSSPTQSGQSSDSPQHPKVDRSFGQTLTSVGAQILPAGVGPDEKLSRNKSATRCAHLDFTSIINATAPGNDRKGLDGTQKCAKRVREK